MRLYIPDMLVETNVKHISIIHCAKSCMGYKCGVNMDFLMMYAKPCGIY